MRIIYLSPAEPLEFIRKVPVSSCFPQSIKKVSQSFSYKTVMQQLCSRRLFAALLTLLLIMLANVWTNMPAAAQQVSFARSSWQMHRGNGVVDLGTQNSNHGDPMLYDFMSIPATNDGRWEAPPLQGGNINFVESSALGGRECRGWADFTYFQTQVAVPADASVTEFRVTFEAVDDGARAYIFNSANPNGAFDPSGDIALNGNSTAADLSSFVVAGETNRVVIVQVDDCPYQNNVRNAQILINGTVADEDPELDVDTGGDVCANIPAPTESDVTVRFINNTGVTGIVYWRNFDGVLQEYQVLEAGAFYDQETFDTHEWIIEDENGNVLGEYTATGALSQCFQITGGASGDPQPVWEQTRTLDLDLENAVSVAWSYSGSYVAIGSADGYVRVWEVSTELIVMEVSVSRFSSSINTISWSPDDGQLAVGMNDGYVVVIDIVTVEIISLFESRNGNVQSVTWSGDGTMVACGFENGVVEIGNVETTEVVSRLEGPTGGVTSVTWYGNWVAAGSLDGTAWIWSTETWEVATVFEEVIGGVTTITSSPDGTYLACGIENGTLLVGDTRTGELVTSIETSTEGITSISWSGTGILVGTDDGVVQVIDSTRWEIVDTITVDGGGIVDVTWTTGSTQFTVVTTDGTVNVRDRSTVSIDPNTVLGPHPEPWSETETLDLAIESATSVAWSGNGLFVAVGSAEGIVQVWEVETRSIIMDITGDGVNSRVNTVAWSPDDTQLAFGLDGGFVVVIDMSTEEVVSVFESSAGNVLSIAWSGDGSLLACGFDSGIIEVGNVESTEVVGTLEGPSGGVSSVFWEGDRVVGGSLDGSAWIWSSTDWQAITRFEGASGGVTSITSSPDGRYLACGLDDGTVLVGDAVTTEIVTTIETRTERVTSIGWYGNRVAVGSNDGVVNIVDSDRWEIIGTVLVGTGDVTSIDWSKDGSQLVTGTNDGTIQVQTTNVIDLRGTEAATIADTSGYYRLQTMFLEGESKCLEGNRLSEKSVLSGAAFQDDCQNVTGQLWKISAESDGYYRLQTLFMEAENKCLEGNRLASESVLGGAAFMDDCQGVTGQLWKFIDAGSGYYRLQTRFLEAENKCLEGNRQAPESVLEGAAFMDACQDVTGQLWKLIPVNVALTEKQGDYSEFTVIIDNVSASSGGSSIEVSGGASISWSLDYQIWNQEECPTCIDQIVIGVGSDTQTCVYDGIPGLNPGDSGSSEFTLIAPNEVGTYDILYRGIQHYSCGQAMEQYESEDLENAIKIGTLIVTEAGSSTGQGGSGGSGGSGSGVGSGGSSTGSSFDSNALCADLPAPTDTDAMVRFVNVGEVDLTVEVDDGALSLGELPVGGTLDLALNDGAKWTVSNANPPFQSVDQGDVSSLLQEASASGSNQDNNVTQRVAACLSVGIVTEGGSTGGSSTGGSSTGGSSTGSGSTGSGVAISRPVLQGQVVDATTKEPIEGAEVCIRSDAGVACFESDSAGRYSFTDLAAGGYVVEVTVAGYTSVEQTFSVVAGETIQQTLALSPDLSTGELRIVLTWGENPSDLDAHLWVPLLSNGCNSGSELRHVYYPEQYRGSLDSYPYAQLDVDDTESYGPETITFSERQDGFYSFAVHHYSGEGTIATSGAVVRVYSGQGLLKEYNPPVGQDGEWWQVFSFDGATGEITDINTMGEPLELSLDSTSVLVDCGLDGF